MLWTLCWNDCLLLEALWGISPQNTLYSTVCACSQISASSESTTLNYPTSSKLLSHSLRVGLYLPLSFEVPSPCIIALCFHCIISLICPALLAGTSLPYINFWPQKWGEGQAAPWQYWCKPISVEIITVISNVYPAEALPNMTDYLSEIRTMYLWCHPYHLFFPEKGHFYQNFISLKPRSPQNSSTFRKHGEILASSTFSLHISVEFIYLLIFVAMCGVLVLPSSNYS